MSVLLLLRADLTSSDTKSPNRRNITSLSYVCLDLNITSEKSSITKKLLITKKVVNYEKS